MIAAMPATSTVGMLTASDLSILKLRNADTWLITNNSTIVRAIAKVASHIRRCQKRLIVAFSIVPPYLFFL